MVLEKVDFWCFRKEKCIKRNLGIYVVFGQKWVYVHFDVAIIVSILQDANPNLYISHILLKHLKYGISQYSFFVAHEFSHEFSKQLNEYCVRISKSGNENIFVT